MVRNVEIWNQHIREVRDLSLTSSQVESCILSYPYPGENRVKDPQVENAQLPPIAIIFYSAIYEFNTIPSPELLISLYLEQEYFSEAEPGNVLVAYNGETVRLSREGIIARVLRTYPSLLRDFHFYLLALESGLFEVVRYSFEDDYYQGIDLKVKYQGKWYSAALMQNTSRSLFFRNRKRYRHNGENADVINVELDRAQCKKCGDYYLFTKSHISSLVKAIEQK